MSEQAPHMVKQVIVYSDGSETVINYRGVIKDGVLTLDEVSGERKEPEESVPAPVEEAVQTPAIEETSPEIPSGIPATVSEEAPINS